MSRASATTVIRPLEHGDIAALQRIDRQAHGEAWSHAAFVDQIDRDCFRHLVAIVDEVVVGHAGTWTERGALHITNVAIDPDATGAGLATDLLVALLSPIADDASGVDRIVLEVRPRNRRAQRLYGRFGFSPGGIARGFYERPDISGNRDAIVMQVGDPGDAAWRDRIRGLAAESAARTEGAAA